MGSHVCMLQTWLKGNHGFSCLNVTDLVEGESWVFMFECYRLG